MDITQLTPSNAQAIIDITKDATKVQTIDGVDDVVVVTDRAGARVVDLSEYRDSPRRFRRSVGVFDAESFLDYVKRNGNDDQLEVWADEERRTVQAVLNGPDDFAGWCDHTATLTLRTTPAWKAWTEGSGKLLGQTVFAEHIEDNLPDIVKPTGAEMLELAQTFQSTSKVDFQSHRFLDNGQRALEYTEATEAKAGRRGQIAIPAVFELGLRPFLGGDPYRVVARLRWRIADGDLRIGYKLDRPEEVLRAAFGDVVSKIDEAVAVRVNQGRP